MNSSASRAGAFLEAGVLAFLGAGVFLDTLAYPAPLGAGAPGPAFFPRLLAVLLVAAAGAVALRRPREREEFPTGGALRLALAAGWIAGALAVLPVLGHLVALPPLVGGLMWLSGERSWGTLIAVPLGFGGAVHLLFVVALGAPLP